MSDYDIEINDELTSKAEQRVLKPLFEGKPRQAAAELLHLALSTVDTHLTHAFEKHHVKNLPELMTKFYAEGLATARKLMLSFLVCSTTLNIFAIEDAHAFTQNRTRGGSRLRLSSRVVRRSSRGEIDVKNEDFEWFVRGLDD